jgi:ABC-type antimicrobial peptide transport system permease subunit
VVARTRDGANGLAEALRRTDPDLQSIKPEPMTAWIERSVGERRLTLSISAGLALLAIALAGVGLYGVIASLAAARHREMALRSALGASPGDILRLVLGQALRLTLPGLLLGLGAAFWFSDVLRSQFFGVGATDPLALGGVVLGIGLLAVAAGLLPALRARRADPAQTLR